MCLYRDRVQQMGMAQWTVFNEQTDLQLCMLEVVKLAKAMDAASLTSGLSFLVSLIRGSIPSENNNRVLDGVDMFTRKGQIRESLTGPI